MPTPFIRSAIFFLYKEYVTCDVRQLTLGINHCYFLHYLFRLSPLRIVKIKLNPSGSPLENVLQIYI